jgi:hypothetical protein
MSFESKLPKLNTYVFCTRWNRVIRVDDLYEHTGFYRGTDTDGESLWYSWQWWRYATDYEIDHWFKAPKYGYEYADVDEGEFVLHVASESVLLVSEVRDHGFIGVDASGQTKLYEGKCRAATDIEVKRWRAGLQ